MMGAVLGHNQGLGFGQIEHLAGRMAVGLSLAQSCAAAVAGAREMIDRDIGRLGAAQRLAGMPRLPAGLWAVTSDLLISAQCG